MMTGRIDELDGVSLLTPIPADEIVASHLPADEGLKNDDRGRSARLPVYPHYDKLSMNQPSEMKGDIHEYDCYDVRSRTHHHPVNNPRGIASR